MDHGMLVVSARIQMTRRMIRARRVVIWNFMGKQMARNLTSDRKEKNTNTVSPVKYRSELRMLSTGTDRPKGDETRGIERSKQVNNEASFPLCR
jgi:hypothetical protein